MNKKYFSYLLKNTERKYLKDTLRDTVEIMAENSAAQLEKLRGTEWENAAVNNLLYFAPEMQYKNVAEKQADYKV